MCPFTWIFLYADYSPRAALMRFARLMLSVGVPRTMWMTLPLSSVARPNSRPMQSDGIQRPFNLRAQRILLSLAGAIPRLASLVVLGSMQLQSLHRYRTWRLLFQLFVQIAKSLISHLASSLSALYSIVTVNQFIPFVAR